MSDFLALFANEPHNSIICTPDVTSSIADFYRKPDPGIDAMTNYFDVDINKISCSTASPLVVVDDSVMNNGIDIDKIGIDYNNSSGGQISIKAGNTNVSIHPQQKQVDFDISNEDRSAKVGVTLSESEGFERISFGSEGRVGSIGASIYPRRKGVLLNGSLNLDENRTTEIKGSAYFNNDGLADTSFGFNKSLGERNDIGVTFFPHRKELSIEHSLKLDKQGTSRLNTNTRFDRDGLNRFEIGMSHTLDQERTVQLDYAAHMDRDGPGGSVQISKIINSGSPFGDNARAHGGFHYNSGGPPVISIGLSCSIM